MDFLSNPIWLLAITLSVYFGAGVLQRKFRSALLSPVVLTAGFMIGYLLIFNISYKTYQSAGTYIEFWLKPSVVALAVPLYLQLERIKKQLIPIFISQIFGSITGIVSVCGIAKLFNANDLVILSLAPKSVTTPIAIDVSTTLGGIPPLTAAAVVITGMLGSVIGFKVLEILKIESTMGKGVALGTASHGLGVMAAMGVSEKYAAFASVGLILNGIATAIFAPIIISIFF